MTLKSVYESSDDVPESLKEYYTEKEGKYSFVGVEGWKPLADYEAVNNALKNERKATKAVKDLFTPWETAFVGKTPAEIQAELERIPVLEADATGKVDKSKLQELVEVAAKNRVVPIERERDTLKGTVAELQAVIQGHETANRRRTIFDAVRDVAAKEGVFHETTYTSANGALMLLAERYFTIDDTTSTVVIAEGVPGIAGGLGVKDALAELGNQHPYLKKVSNGGGASGSTGTGGGPNPFKADNLTDRAAHISKYPDKWEKDMKAAGLKSPMQLHGKK